MTAGLPAASRAMVLESFKSANVMREFPLPKELAAGEVLVRVDMAGICGTDVHLRDGELPIPLPVILGHETAGTVAAVGSAVKADWSGAPLRVGDRVTWHSSQVCGRCRYCTVHKLPARCRSRKAYGVSHSCNSPGHLLGGYADYHLLREGTAIFRIPDTVPTEAVIGGGCAIVTAIHGCEVIGIHWGDRVVVQGAGPVGLAAAAIAKDSGAGRLIVIGGPAHRLELARRFGADEVVNLDEVRDPEARRKRILDLTDGEGADVVLECVGRPAAVAEGWELARDGGRYLVLGHYCDAGPVPLNPHVITRKMLTVKGAWSSEHRHTALALQLYRDKHDRYPFADMVSHRYPLQRLDEALAATASWSVRKSVIVPAMG